MKITRKIIAGICVFSLALSAVSCGKNDSSSTSSPDKAKKPSAQTTTAVTGTEAPEESETQPVTEEETAQPEITEEPETSAPETETEPPAEEDTQIFTDDENYVEYHFRKKQYLNEHFEKHGGEFRDDFGYQTAQEYEKGASDVINNPDALYKTEAEDGDGVYYIEATNEFVILSTDGYIRTYFRPDKGIDYFNRQ